MTDTPYSWTVSVIVIRDEKHEFVYSELEQAILTTPKNRNIRYVIFYYSVENELVSVKELTDNNDQPYQFSDHEPYRADFFDPQTLTDFFNTHVVRPGADPARHRNMVILLGHGAGLGITANWEENRKRMNFLADLDSFLSLNKEKADAINQFFTLYAVLNSNLSFDNNASLIATRLNSHSIKKLFTKSEMDRLINRLKVINMEQLAGIFRNSVKKVDVLINLCCYTQMIEGGYSLKDQVDLIVAPQSSMTFCGINYKALFKKMAARPEISLTRIGENIIDNYSSKYEEEPFHSQLYSTILNEEDYRLVNISANRTSYYRDLVRNLDELSAYLLRNDPAIALAVEGARDSCGDLTQNDACGLIDLTFLYQQLLDRSGTVPALEEINAQFKQLRNDCLIARNIPAGPPDPYLARERNGRMVTESPLFLSVFFMKDQGLDMQAFIRSMYFESDTRSAFRDECRWDEFLKKYLGL